MLSQQIRTGPKNELFFEAPLCEFAKYERVRLGEGKPKRRFVRPDTGGLFQ
jgi:hypothetical protein